MLERSPALGPLRDKPAFRDILRVAETAAAIQHERVLAMEYAGELAPVPGRVY